MDFVHIFSWSHPSQLRAFVRFENFSLPIMNWQVAILIPISCKQPTAIITLTFYNDIVQITFVKKFFVRKVRNHNYGKSFEFQFYEIIIMSVQLAGHSQ